MLSATLLLVGVAGCGIAAKIDARKDMAASKIAYKTCLVQHSQDVGNIRRRSTRTYNNGRATITHRPSHRQRFAK